MKNAIIMILLFSPFMLSAQGNLFSLTAEEDSLVSLFREIRQSEDDQKKILLNEAVTEVFEDILGDENAFNYPFDSLKYVGKLQSEDKLVRIFTWNIMLTDNSYRYYGFVQYKKGSRIVVTRLDDRSSSLSDPENASLSAEDWFGALYYKLIEVSDKRRRFYTLLGWRGNNTLTTQKVIDVMYFGYAGHPRFGTPLFSMVYEKYPGIKRNIKKKRVVFEYSARVNMSLTWDTQLKMIVFDHLAPQDIYLKGNYRFYGPDFTHDALTFKDGKWNHIENIDLRRSSDPKFEQWRFRPEENSFDKKR
jgi:hypothetical protein